MKITNLTPWLKHRARKKSTVVDTVVLHATGGGSLSGAIETLRDRGLSYHYLIDKDGNVTKGCPSTTVAFHAGVSTGPHGAVGNSVNEYTIGISFVNMNDGKHPYTTDQTKSAEQIINELKQVFPLKFLTTHWGVSYPRKDDPFHYDSHALADRVGLSHWSKPGVPDLSGRDD